MNEIDFRKELASAPLNRNGFTEQLRHRIEQRIAGKSKWAKWRLPLVTGVCFVLILAGAIQWVAPKWMEEQTGVLSSLDTNPDGGINHGLDGTESSMDSISESSPLKSALLIGLRTDRAVRNNGRHLTVANQSSYRTLLIAPQRDRLIEAAEGNGVLVPYGQRFWKVEALSSETSSDAVQYLVAHPADRPVVPHSFEDDPDVEWIREEKLLFVGNEYLSMSEREQTWDGSGMSVEERVYVRTLPQISDAEGRPDFSGHPSDEEHVPLQAIFGDSQQGENWAIVREPGQWVPRVALIKEDGNRGGSSFNLHPVSYALPESVVSHDTLCCSWQSIRQMEPDAIDAVSSPEYDIIAVVTPNQIRIYQIGEASAPLLTIDLQDNEELIMAQWATVPYIDQWISEAGRLLTRS